MPESSPLSDAAVTAYANWGAYGASKAALHHLSRIWNEELADEGVRVVSWDPGDMDTPLHAIAVPDADPSTLERPEASARELADLIETTIARQSAGEMCAQGAIHRRHFIVLETDRILLVRGETLHHQVGDNGRQVVPRTMQRPAIDLCHFMGRQRNGDGLAVQVIIHRDEHFGKVDSFLMRDLHQQI